MNSTSDVMIQSKSLERARTFYEGALGFEVVEDSDGILGFDTGSFTLYVEVGDRPDPVFEFLVEDVEVAKERLLEKGCELVEEDASRPRCYLRDPFGLVFNLHGSDE